MKEKSSFSICYLIIFKFIFDKNQILLINLVQNWQHFLQNIVAVVVKKIFVIGQYASNPLNN